MRKILTAFVISLFFATGTSTAGEISALLGGIGAQVVSNIAAKALGTASTSESSRQLNDDAWQDARAAEEIFRAYDNGNTKSRNIADQVTYDPKNAKEARRLIEAYRKASAPIRAGPGFTEQQLADYAKALMPFMRYAQQGLPQSGATILPGQKKIFQAQTFCLDRELPAPIPQDNLRLVPSSTLIPNSNKALYEALMRVSTSRPDARFAIQNLVWGLRHAHQGYKPYLDNDTQSILNEALPGGAEQYQNFVQESQRELQQSQQRQQLFQQLQSLVADKAHINLPPPSSMDGSFTVGDVAQSMVALNRAPAPPPNSVAEGSPYTRIAPNVAVRVSSAVMASSMQIEVVNAGDQPFRFVATDYVGQTVRPTQRMAIAGLNDARPDSQYDWAWGSPAQIAQKKLHEVMTALEIHALKQAQQNIQSWLDRQAEGGASQPMLAALALGTAVNEVLLPTTALDLLPLTKAGKMAEVAADIEKAIAANKTIHVDSKGNAIIGDWSSTNAMSAPENALSHWVKHSDDFPEFANASQYAEAAQAFVHNPPPGTLIKYRPNGDVLLYEPSSNTFAVRSASGIPRTMFRPSSGISYWGRQ